MWSTNHSGRSGYGLLGSAQPGFEYVDRFNRGLPHHSRSLTMGSLRSKRGPSRNQSRSRISQHLVAVGGPACRGLR